LGAGNTGASDTALYKGTLQARLVAQGATVEEFDRLRPLFAPCMTTFLFGDLWP
jgi:hypothetical protein